MATNISSKDSFPIDIDGDLVPDITVNSYCYIGCCNTASKPISDAIYLTSSNGVESVFTPSNGCCPGDSVIKNLTVGTIFNSGLDWRVLTPTLSLMGASYQRHEVIYYSSRVPAFTYTSGLWINSFYAGFRKILPSSDTIYGWIQLNSNFPGKVIDYAFTCGTYTAAPPTSTITTAPTAICKGDSLVLNANPSGGIFSGPGIVGNKFKSSTLSPGTYTVFYNLPNPAGCSTISSVLNLTVNPLPTLAFTNTNTSIGFCDSLILQATPPGGVFFGSGVTANVFRPIIPGTTTISYSYTNTNGCSNTVTLNVNVATASNTLGINVSSNVILSCPGQSVVLTAIGATSYSWSNGAITQSIVVSPTVTTTYTVIGKNYSGCVYGINIFNQVVGTPTVTAFPYLNNICPGTNTQLSANGATSYTWSTGVNSQICNINPTVTTTYTVIGALVGGCSDTTTVTQAVSVPTVIASASSNSICAGTKISLIGSGAISYLWNTGNTLNFYDYPVVTTSYSVIGYGNGTCSDTAYTTVNVDNTNLTLTITTSNTLICAGDTATIYLNGSTSGYLFQSLDEYTQIITGSSTVQITPTTTTTYVVYGNQLPSGCLATGFFTQQVSACVGVNEIIKEGIDFKIFPNPNSGEFEIKSTKEINIFITNELGQLIKTIELNSANNFSSKITELQSGVYFVGNKLSRLKVVVIK